MSDIESVQASQNQQQQVQQNAPVEETEQVQPIGGGEDMVDLNASFSNYNDFAKAYPKLHDAMIKGIANTVINDMKHHQERMKQIMKEGERQANGG